MTDSLNPETQPEPTPAEPTPAEPTSPEPAPAIVAPAMDATPAADAPAAAPIAASAAGSAAFAPTPAATPPSATEPPLPAYEPAEPGTFAPAEAVARESGAPGAEVPGRRSSGVRWAIALIGVALVVGATAIVLALASGRPSTSIAVGYMPDDTIIYGEYRLDLPGDQRENLAGFLSAFPGFDDQAAIDTKLDEAFDRLVAAISSDKQTYTADIEPWFAGQIAYAMGPFAIPDLTGSSFSTAGGQSSLFVVTVKDKEKATAWLEKVSDGALTRGDYNGAITLTGPAGNVGPAFLIAINDEVLLAGPAAEVRAAVDSKGDGKLADDSEFKAAFGIVNHDYVTFSFIDYRSFATSYFDVISGAGGNLDSTTVDDEILSLVPAWFGAVGWFENDAFVGQSAYPSVDIGYDARNKKSTLLGLAPPNTVVYSEAHDVGAALTALLGRFREMPELRDAFSQIDQATSTVGSFEGLLSWWGDIAVVVSSDDNGVIGGGLLIQPTDVALAQRTFESIRSLIVFGGGSAGIEVRDVQHGDATVTVIDFSGAMGSAAESLPPGYKAEIAYTITKDVVVIGYGEAFVESVLDAGPGPSLADDPRVASLVKRVGEENLGMTFVDIRAIRELIEPLAKAEASPEEWARYEKEIRPFLLPFDAYASSAREDGDIDRLPSVFTVTKP
jgi:Protein of unknown function (DUF3352)